eukprot:TRINITY_DN67253_c0_g1_i1.p1 TRINITY_DN67253_c0_g1~~TRINITY_DN67253_c0_g1_i1.p1  ORF type:complete len:927 (-),score=132.05 TRINITY_DN67253_c0_g1_i1:191-2971(-)
MVDTPPRVETCLSPLALLHASSPRSHRSDLPVTPSTDLACARKVCAAPHTRQLIEALERHYESELRRISPQWTFSIDGPTHQPVNVAETVGVPGIVLGAILAGKCRDQRIPVTAERQQRFAEWMHRHCGSLWFTLHDSGVGPECAKGVVLALALNDRFTSLSLACNTLGDAGAAVVARVLPEHQALLHLDLSANALGHAGADAIFEALLLNRSVTYLDLSSRAGSRRNHFAKHNAPALENLMATNPVLAKLSLQSTCLGPEAAAGLARGLAINTTLVSLDLAGDDLGPRGAAALAEALGPNCGLEELNLSDNHLGDEGLSVLSTKLGALPPAVDGGSVSTSSAMATSGHAAAGSMPLSAGSQRQNIEGSQVPWAPPKYYEALVSLKRAFNDLTIADLAIREETERQAALARVTGGVQVLHHTLESTTSSPLPRLRVLQLGGNGATAVGASRIEDALQTNQVIERLTLDRADHRGVETHGAKSLLTSLSLNTGLIYLSLSQCGIKSAGIIDLAKALAMNRTLQILNLCGNRFGDEAAAALGTVLGSGPGGLRHLNCSSCHLEDSCGVALAQGLGTNNTLETLNLRDNLLRSGAGGALADALRRHTVLTNLVLELNNIDFRFLSLVRQLLDRNMRFREKDRPAKYRSRIEDLKCCEREVAVLESTIRRNESRKMKAKMKEASLLQDLVDTAAREQKRQEDLEGRLQAVRSERASADEQVTEVNERLRAVRAEGEYEASQIQARINSVEDLIRRHEKHIEQTKRQKETHREQADQELAVLKEESDRAEMERERASHLHEAAQRNLDSFAASLKSIEEDVAGGADPRHRIVEHSSRGERQFATGTPRAGASSGPSITVNTTSADSPTASASMSTRRPASSSRVGVGGSVGRRPQLQAGREAGREPGRPRSCTGTARRRPPPAPAPAVVAS